MKTMNQQWIAGIVYTDSEGEPDEYIVATHLLFQQLQRLHTKNKSPTGYEEIVVEQPPPSAIFSIIFGPLADSILNSFKDALSCPDRKI
jgi:hypothetical protein